MDGILVIDKPAGPTSARVVAAVKRAIRAKKVGHTGTLDPMATGVLPMCVGQATKIAQFLLADDKAYEAELVLGVETDTLDAAGEITAESSDGAAAITEDALRAALATKLGDSMQTPPMYSALRSGGKRLHELARAGEVVERPPRAIRIDAIELLSFDPPRARFAVSCSKGTYVRTLAADIGADLGCGAHLSALRRTRSGRFAIDAAIALDELTPERAAVALVDLATALDHLPAAEIPPDRIAQVANGLRLGWTQISNDDEPLGPVCLVNPDGGLRAVVRVVDGTLRYERVLQRDP